MLDKGQSQRIEEAVVKVGLVGEGCERIMRTSCEAFITLVSVPSFYLYEYNCLFLSSYAIPVILRLGLSAYCFLYFRFIKPFMYIHFHKGDSHKYTPIMKTHRHGVYSSAKLQVSQQLMTEKQQTKNVYQMKNVHLPHLKSVLLPREAPRMVVGDDYCISMKSEVRM
jgi:hypothetical protein